MPDRFDVTAPFRAPQAVRPALSVSDRTFDLGECGPGRRRDVLFSVTNRSDELPLPFAISRLPYFHARPAVGRLLPRQSMNVVLTFAPSSLGVFRNTLQLVAGAGLAVVLLKVCAACAPRWGTSTLTTLN